LFQMFLSSSLESFWTIGRFGELMLTDQLRELIEGYVAGVISMSDFSQRFASLYFAVRQQTDAPETARRLCSVVVGPLAEYSRGDRAESSLRVELEKLLASERRGVQA
jgi:hypothetical protein